MDRYGHRHLLSLASVSPFVYNPSPRSEKQDTWTQLTAPINMTRRWPYLIKCFPISLLTCSLFFCESDSADLDTDHCWHWRPISRSRVSLTPTWSRTLWAGEKIPGLEWERDTLITRNHKEIEQLCFSIVFNGFMFYCSEQKVSPYCSQKLKALFITLFLLHFCPEY